LFLFYVEAITLSIEIHRYQRNIDGRKQDMRELDKDVFVI